jgi:hypothetical protein
MPEATATKIDNELSPPLEGEICDDEDVKKASVRQIALMEVERKRKKQRHYRTKFSVKAVIDMASVGMTEETIAAVLSISEKTLRKHYEYELKTAHAIANAAIGGKLYSKAMAGDVAALIFWAKTRMGFSESKNVNVNATGDFNMTFEVVPIVKNAIKQIKNTNSDDTPLLPAP